MAIGTIGYPEIQKSPFDVQGSLANGIAMRLAQAKAQKEESEVPYAGRKALADAINQELMNKGQENTNTYYGRSKEAEIGERNANTKYLGAETSAKDLERMYPNIKDAGIKGDMDRRRFLIDHQSRMQGKQHSQQSSPMVESLAPIIRDQTQQQVPGNIANGVAPILNGEQGAPQAGNVGAKHTQKSYISGDLGESSPVAMNALQQPNSNPEEQQKTSILQQSNPQSFDEIKALERNINADIGGKEALAKYHERAIGAGKGGVNIQQQAKLMEDLKRDNPDLTDDQVYEAAGNLVQGKQTLDDGTPFRAGGLSQTNASKVALQGTTSSLATNLVQGKQAEAEIGVLSKFALEGIKPYGDTYFNKSPDQIYDSLSNDPKSQKKLGKLIAAKQLQYEIAQNETKLAGGQPGVTNTQELMHLGQQSIDTHFPKLSYEAREEAQRYFLEALKEGFKARQKVGTKVNAANAVSEETPEHPVNSEENTPSPSSNVPTAKWVRKNGQLVRIS